MPLPVDDVNDGIILSLSLLKLVNPLPQLLLDLWVQQVQRLHRVQQVVKVQRVQVVQQVQSHLMLPLGAAGAAITAGAAGSGEWTLSRSHRFGR